MNTFDNATKKHMRAKERERILGEMHVTSTRVLNIAVLDDSDDEEQGVSKGGEQKSSYRSYRDYNQADSAQDSSLNLHDRRGAFAAQQQILDRQSTKSTSSATSYASADRADGPPRTSSGKRSGRAGLASKREILSRRLSNKAATSTRSFRDLFGGVEKTISKALTAPGDREGASPASRRSYQTEANAMAEFHDSFSAEEKGSLANDSSSWKPGKNSNLSALVMQLTEDENGDLPLYGLDMDAAGNRDADYVPSHGTRLSAAIAGAYGGCSLWFRKFFGKIRHNIITMKPEYKRCFTVGFLVVFVVALGLTLDTQIKSRKIANDAPSPAALKSDGTPAPHTSLFDMSGENPSATGSVEEGVAGEQGEQDDLLLVDDAVFGKVGEEGDKHQKNLVDDMLFGGGDKTADHDITDDPIFGEEDDDDLVDDASPGQEDDKYLVDDAIFGGLEDDKVGEVDDLLSGDDDLFGDKAEVNNKETSRMDDDAIFGDDNQNNPTDDILKLADDAIFGKKDDDDTEGVFAIDDEFDDDIIDVEVDVDDEVDNGVIYFDDDKETLKEFETLDDLFTDNKGGLKDNSAAVDDLQFELGVNDDAGDETDDVGFEDDTDNPIFAFDDIADDQDDEVSVGVDDDDFFDDDDDDSESTTKNGGTIMFDDLFESGKTAPAKHGGNMDIERGNASAESLIEYTLSNIGILSSSDLRMKNSPQRKALDFVIGDYMDKVPVVAFDTDSEFWETDPFFRSLVEHYVLAVLFFSLNPSGATPENVDWLRVGHRKCDSPRLLCEEHHSSSEVIGVAGVYLNTKLHIVTGIDLSNAGFQGNLPNEVVWLLDLRSLDLSGNELTGQMPKQWSQMTNLRKLDLGSNELSGPWEPEWAQMTGLRVLSLKGNNLSGTISISPNWVNMKLLNLQGNLFKGALPKELGYMTRLEGLYLDDNQFTGSIPRTMGRLSLLSELTLDNNSLNGSLPPEVGLLSELRLLSLGFNNLSGTVPPSMTRLAKLNVLDVSHNELVGRLPVNIGNMKSLKVIHLENNSLQGSLPETLGELGSLESLFLEKNNFVGSIPYSVGSMERLRELTLHENGISGTIPKNVAQLYNLQILSLHNNRISGNLPHGLGLMNRLAALQLHSNDLTGIVPKNVCSLRLQSLTADCTEIECSCCTKCY